MREATFLAANRRLAAQPHIVSRIAGRTWRNPLAVRPPQFKRGQSTESTPVSTESEKKRRDDTEVFGNMLSNLEQGEGLPEAGVVNQPLSTEEVVMVVNEEVMVPKAVMNEDEIERGILALETSEVTANAETYDGTSNVAVEKVAVEEIVVAKVAMKEVAMETQPEVVEEKKKKKKSKGRKAGEADSSHHRKEKKNKEKKDDDEDEEAKKEMKKKEKEERKMHQREKRSDLHKVEVKVDDEDVALILLTSLPPSYETFVDSYIGGKETLTLEDTKSTLLMREDRQNAESSVTKGSRSDDICNYCKEKGHWKTECPKIKRNQEKKEKSDKRETSASVAQVEIDSVEVEIDFEGYLALVVNEQSHSNDVWVLDSRASYHMCPNRE
ncbi:glutamic acid-rich protein-like [Benincasa hispida]|uniref:glutamic acid-rich protein-like n=1 Tax=Benincasa hispida TaxID=102211 RepID=UPI0018FFF58B|nr:glutamic acid-rich protein-like [Benincasa hispida]